MSKMFQFHKGTIRTRHLPCMMPNKRQFQFHKGTIRTYTGHKVQNSKLSFNSIKVRLELLNLPLLPTLILFQFHKGTIRTTVMIIVPYSIRCFNSIKVRLERTIKLHINP